jgi:hypothetical protein
MTDVSFKIWNGRTSRVAQWSKALHHSARGVATDPGSIPGCVAASRNRETHEAAHKWPSVIRVREGFVIVQLRSSYSCCVTRLPVGQCFLWHIGAAGFWVKQAVCQEAGLLGRVVFRSRQLSRVRTGVAAMGQDCNYQLGVKSTKKL